MQCKPATKDNYLYTNILTFERYDNLLINSIDINLPAPSMLHVIKHRYIENPGRRNTMYSRFISP